MVIDNWPGRSYGMKTVHIDQNIDLTNRYVEGTADAHAHRGHREH